MRRVLARVPLFRRVVWSTKDFRGFLELAADFGLNDMNRDVLGVGGRGWKDAEGFS
jgi:hypothetical protein